MKQKMYAVVRIGNKNKTIQSHTLRDIDNKIWPKNLKSLTIFKTKRAAFLWKDYWINQFDFEIVEIETDYKLA